MADKFEELFKRLVLFLLFCFFAFYFFLMGKKETTLESYSSFYWKQCNVFVSQLPIAPPTLWHHRSRNIYTSAALKSISSTTSASPTRLFTTQTSITRNGTTTRASCLLNFFPRCCCVLVITSCPPPALVSSLFTRFNGWPSLHSPSLFLLFFSLHFFLCSSTSAYCTGPVRKQLNQPIVCSYVEEVELETVHIAGIVYFIFLFIPFSFCSNF